MSKRSCSTNMASYMTAVRTLMKGAHSAPARWLLTRSSQTPAARPGLWLHQRKTFSAAASRCSSGTEPRGSPDTDAQRARRTAGQEREEQEYTEYTEYIPRKKAKNPMTSVGFAWMIGLPSGIIIFLLAKREVDKNRQKQLKVRQRMKRSNEGEYEGSRYQHSGDVKLDQ